MNFSLKTLLLITTMLPVSTGFISGIATLAEFLVAWFYSYLFPGVEESWDDKLVHFLIDMFRIGDPKSYFHVTVCMPLVPGWIALACVNVFLVWTRQRHFVFMAAVIIVAMPLHVVFVGRWLLGITIFGIHPDPDPALVVVLAQLVGASISIIAAGIFVLLRSHLERSEIHLGNEQQELKAKYVVLISAFLFFTSMYGWWRINA